MSVIEVILTTIGVAMLEIGVAVSVVAVFALIASGLVLAISCFIN